VNKCKNHERLYKEVAKLTANSRSHCVQKHDTEKHFSLREYLLAGKLTAKLYKKNAKNDKLPSPNFYCQAILKKPNLNSFRIADFQLASLRYNSK